MGEAYVAKVTGKGRITTPKALRAQVRIPRERMATLAADARTRADAISRRREHPDKADDAGRTLQTEGPYPPD